MKLISWNVNGLRACLTHGFAESFAALDADIFSVQETKMQPGQADFAPEGYTEYTYSAEKKGYSGTACWCKTAPLAVTTGIGLEQHDHEGRVLTLEYPGFYLVNCYTPNSQDGLKRLDYRMEWEDAFRAYLLALPSLRQFNSKKYGAIWQVTDFGGEGRGENAIDIFMRENGYDRSRFNEAILKLAAQFDIRDELDRSVNRPEIRQR